MTDTATRENDFLRATQAIKQAARLLLDEHIGHDCQHEPPCSWKEHTGPMCGVCERWEALEILCRNPYQHELRASE